MVYLIVIGIIVLIMIIWVIGTYNTLVRLIEFVRNNLKQIDIQLDRRYKVFENLISVVKKYMDYEKTTLKDVIALRAQAQEAKEGPTQKVADRLTKQAPELIKGFITDQYGEKPPGKQATTMLRLFLSYLHSKHRLVIK